MSEIEVVTATPDELAPEIPDLARRSFPVELYPGIGRTVDLRIVPYGERATCVDGLGGVPPGIPYDEEFLPGVFDHQARAANRVLLDVEHESGVAGIVGHGVELASRDDGFHGSFKLHETPGGEIALTLIREGVLTGASVECRFVKSLRSAGGIVQRVKAQLNKVALCREGAYSGALVLGLRSAPPEIDESLRPIPFDPEIAQRIEALGLSVPETLRAHPAPGTPSDDDGTPESDTRQGESTTEEVTANGGNGSRGQARSSG